MKCSKNTKRKLVFEKINSRTRKPENLLNPVCGFKKNFLNIYFELLKKFVSSTNRNCGLGIKFFYYF